MKDMEEEMLVKINSLGIGPGGLGGTTTALAVNINTYPTHIAGLPVGINICCHVTDMSFVNFKRKTERKALWKDICRLRFQKKN